MAVSAILARSSGQRDRKTRATIQLRGTSPNPSLVRGDFTPREGLRALIRHRDLLLFVALQQLCQFTALSRQFVIAELPCNYGIVRRNRRPHMGPAAQQ